MGFDFPPLVVSNPLPPQTASHRTHQLFKVLATAPNYSSPHQTRSSGHANGGFLFSCLPSFWSALFCSPTVIFFPLCEDYCGLFFFFSFSPLRFSSLSHQSASLLSSVLPQSPVFWLHGENGAKSSYYQAGVAWTTRSKDKPERGREEAAVVGLGGLCRRVNHLCILKTRCFFFFLGGVWMGNPNLIKLLPLTRHILTLQRDEEAQGITHPVTMLQSQT